MARASAVEMTAAQRTYAVRYGKPEFVIADSGARLQSTAEQAEILLRVTGAVQNVRIGSRRHAR